ncbi:putative U-box domain-containing protein 42 [Tanacetum coccineum]
MKRGHNARFMDRTSQCETDPIPALFSLPSRKPMVPPSQNSSMFKSTQSMTTRPKLQAMSTRSTINYDATIEKSMADFKIKDGYVFKGVVAALPDEPRACGMERLVKIKTHPMRVSNLWRDKPALLLCIRRPGCVMCRAEAHKLYSKKPIFDSLGINLFAVLHEHIESETSGPDIERNFGDWAPLSEIIEIEIRLKNQELDNEYSITSRDYE